MFVTPAKAGVQKLCTALSPPLRAGGYEPEAASGSRNVHNQATNFSVLKRDPHALALHDFKDLNCYDFTNSKFTHPSQHIP